MLRQLADLKFSKGFIKMCHMKTIILHPTKYDIADKLCADFPALKKLKDDALADIKKDLQIEVDDRPRRRRSSLEDMENF